jgi:hypothetical protein
MTFVWTQVVNGRLRNKPQREPAAAHSTFNGRFSIGVDSFWSFQFLGLLSVVSRVLVPSLLMPHPI